jgi:hypothetical protein
VNKLIANIKQIYKQILNALKDPETLLNPAADDPDGHDSDEEKTYIEHRTIAPVQSDRYGPAGTNNSGSSDDNILAGSDDEERAMYERMFGRYYFHAKIPVLRNLWRYRRYRQRNARRSENRWKDTYVLDYPLRYYRGKVVMWGLRVLVAVLAYFGSEKHRRARARDNMRRKRRKRDEGGTSCTTSSDSEEEEEDSTGSGRDREGVERKDFGKGGTKRKGAKRST